MNPENNGAPNAPIEIAGAATRDSVQTDLQPNDGTASGGDTVDKNALPGLTLPPDDVDLPGPAFNLESPSSEPES
jgi:hypothetical protein